MNDLRLQENYFWIFKLSKNTLWIVIISNHIYFAGFLPNPLQEYFSNKIERVQKAAFSIL